MEKAQTSIEMLILLAGAIMVTIIVGVALKNIGSQSANTTTNTIKCTIMDCTSCKTTTGCAGYQLDGTQITWDALNPSCTETEKTLFSSCQSTT